MRTHILNLTLFFLISLLSACVSIDIKQKELLKSNQIEINPPKNFSSKEIEGLDYYWMNENGNSISVKTACDDPADPLLSDIEKASLNNLEVLTAISRKNIMFNSRAALKSQSFIQLDGVAVFLELFIFKKNNCNYIISYVGTKQNYQKQLQDYENFLKNIRVY